MGDSQTLGDLIIDNGGTATLGAPAPAPFAADADFGAAPENLTNGSIQAVPEPGSATLLAGGILTLLGLRRRRE